jgi:hypothetical protein
MRSRIPRRAFRFFRQNGHVPEREQTPIEPPNYTQKFPIGNIELSRTLPSQECPGNEESMTYEHLCPYLKYNYKIAIGCLKVSIVSL